MKTKCHLWGRVRHHFRLLLFGSMAELLTALIRGIAPQNPIFGDSVVGMGSMPEDRRVAVGRR